MMTQEEMRHLVDALSYNIRPHIHTSSDERRTAEYMAERNWINKVFMDAMLGETQDSEAHPNRHRHYLGHWQLQGDECSRVSRRRPLSECARKSATSCEPAELTAGDTSALDDFLGGFAGEKK